MKLSLFAGGGKRVLSLKIAGPTAFDRVCYEQLGKLQSKHCSVHVLPVQLLPNVQQPELIRFELGPLLTLRELQNQGLSVERFGKLLVQLQALLKELEAHKLDPCRCVLENDWLFVNPANTHLYAAYLPLACVKFSHTSTLIANCIDALNREDAACSALRLQLEDVFEQNKTLNLPAMLECIQSAYARFKSLECPYVLCRQTGSERMVITHFPFHVGRGSTDTPQLAHCLEVSREHALLDFDGTSLVLQDCASMNGSFVNGCRVEAGVSVPLKLEDVVQFGSEQFVLQASSA